MSSGLQNSDWCALINFHILPMLKTTTNKKYEASFLRLHCSRFFFLNNYILSPVLFSIFFSVRLFVGSCCCVLHFYITIISPPISFTLIPYAFITICLCRVCCRWFINFCCIYKEQFFLCSKTNKIEKYSIIFFFFHI